MQMEERRLKWIHWAIDIIKQLWEKWTDFLDMYTVEEKFRGFGLTVFFYDDCLYCVWAVPL